MEEPLVSVIVPVYNAGEFLREALDSLRGQTYTRFEAILVNDGSTDDSEAICREVCGADPRFRLVSQENRGVSAARNRGIDEAEGEWISFLDADDMLYPHSLKLLARVGAESRAQVVIGGFRYGRNMPCPRGRARLLVLGSEQAIEVGMYQKRRINNPWGALYKAAVFRGDDAPRFREGRYEDLDIFYRVFERVPFVAVFDHTVYFYRFNPSSFINTWTESRLDVLRVTDDMLAHVKEKHPHLVPAAADRRFSAHFNILLLLLRSKESRPDVKNRCWDVVKSERARTLFNGKTRLKNKLGALVSYGGLPAVRLLSYLSMI